MNRFGCFQNEKPLEKKYEDMDLVRPETDLCPNKMDVVALLLSLVSCHPEKVLRFPFEVMCTFYNP